MNATPAMNTTDLQNSSLFETVYTRVPRAICRRFALTKLGWILVANFLVLGFPPWLVFYFGFRSSFRFSETTSLLAISFVIASFWIFIGPINICLWENRYFKFVNDLIKHCRYKNDLGSKFTITAVKYRNSAVYAGLCSAALSLFFFYISYDYVKTLIVFDGKPFVVVATIFVLVSTGYNIGYGFVGAWQTLIIFWNIDSLKLKWTPFHSDSLGGFGFLGDFALLTSFSFAGGMVLIPATVLVADQIASASVWVIWSALALYSVFIFALFAFPMLQGYAIAKTQRDSVLVKIGTEATKLFDRIQLIEEDWWEARASAEINKLEKIYVIERGVKDASPLPFSNEVLIKVIPVIVSPLFSTSVLVWLVQHIPVLSPIIEQAK